MCLFIRAVILIQSTSCRASLRNFGVFCKASFWAPPPTPNPWGENCRCHRALQPVLSASGSRIFPLPTHMSLWPIQPHMLGTDRRKKICLICWVQTEGKGSASYVGHKQKGKDLPHMLGTNRRERICLICCIQAEGKGSDRSRPISPLSSAGNLVAHTVNIRKMWHLEEE